MRIWPLALALALALAACTDDVGDDTDTGAGDSDTDGIDTESDSDSDTPVDTDTDTPVDTDTDTDTPVDTDSDTPIDTDTDTAVDTDTSVDTGDPPPPPGDYQPFCADALAGEPLAPGSVTLAWDDSRLSQITQECGFTQDNTNPWWGHVRLEAGEVLRAHVGNAGDGRSAFGLYGACDGGCLTGPGSYGYGDLFYVNPSGGPESVLLSLGTLQDGFTSGGDLTSTFEILSPTPLALADTCADASVTGEGLYLTDHAGLSNTFDQVCVQGFGTIHPEGFLRVAVPTGQLLRATFTLIEGETPYLGLFDACSADFSTCDAEAQTYTGAEVALAWHNDSAADVERVLLLDSTSYNDPPGKGLLSIRTTPARALPAVDTCADLTGATRLTSADAGLYVGDLATYAADRVTDGSCTNTRTLEGEDALVPLTLAPGETLIAEIERLGIGDLTAVLVADCADAASCLTASDPYGASGIRYTNEGLDPVDLTLVLDSDYAGNGTRFVLTLGFE